MTALILTLALGVFGAGAAVQATNSESGPPPTRIIFDTDMDSDCDDAGALAILHALADAGEAQVLATMVSSLHDYAVPCVAAINRHYGRPDLPIGRPQGKGPVWRDSKYARKIAEEFPTAYRTSSDAPDAAGLYRQILAGQPDGAVVIVSVGDLTNLRDLLATGPDEHSPLPGPELVRRKVCRYVCMGGRYPEHLDPAVYGNFKTDPESAVAVARDWPTPLVFTGLGDDVPTGAALRRTPEGNPVRRVYELYLGAASTRPSWDPIATLFAVRGPGRYFRLRHEGSNLILPNGTNRWLAEPDSATHVLLEWEPGMREACRSELDELMGRPPASAR